MHTIHKIFLSAITVLTTIALPLLVKGEGRGEDQLVQQTTTPSLDVSKNKYSIDGLRNWTLQDSLRVRSFLTYADLGLVQPRIDETRIGAPSPSGKYFFYVSRHADLACDCNLNELSIYTAADVKRALERSARGKASAPKPLHTVTLKHRMRPITLAR